jgi:hypothetical protein
MALRATMKEMKTLTKFGTKISPKIDIRSDGNREG